MSVVTYLFDPLCGWCYGAAPALERLAAQPDHVLDLAPTGLFAGDDARRMDRDLGGHAWMNDQRIARMTGQVFSDAYRRDVLGAEGGHFDSGPATLALTAVRLTTPAREHAALTAIQRARYVEGRDIAAAPILAAILGELGLDEAARRLRGPDEVLAEVSRTRVGRARQALRAHGLNGVPALLV